MFWRNLLFPGSVSAISIMTNTIATVLIDLVHKHFKDEWTQCISMLTLIDLVRKHFKDDMYVHTGAHVSVHSGRCCFKK